MGNMGRSAFPSLSARSCSDWACSLAAAVRLARFILPEAADQPSRNTCLNDMLEHVAEHLAVTEPLITSTRERRMIRNLVLDAQTAEPAVCQVNVDLAAVHPF